MKIYEVGTKWSTEHLSASTAEAAIAKYRKMMRKFWKNRVPYDAKEIRSVNLICNAK